MAVFLLFAISFTPFFLSFYCRAVVRLTVAISISFFFLSGGGEVGPKENISLERERRVSITGQSRTRSTAARDDL